jgi:hypothetical protein
MVGAAQFNRGRARAAAEEKMSVTKQSRIAEAMKIRELAIFCLTHGAKLYTGWTGEKLFKYLAFQWFSGNLVWYRDDEANLAGVFIAWRDSVVKIEPHLGTSEYLFNWGPTDVFGDALTIGDVIVKHRDGLTRLLQLASARWPDWKMRRLFTHRRGELVEISPAAARRFFHEPKHS